MARWSLGLLATLITCAPPEIGPVVPHVVQPTIRIGLPVTGFRVDVGGGAALTLSTGDRATVIPVAAGTTVTLTAGRDGLRVSSAPSLAPLASLTLAPADSGAPVRLNAREYRGVVVLAPGSSGLSATNLIEVEPYLRGVVGAEMGRRNEQDLAALRAQAIVSRTLALKSLGRWRLRGYDLMATVADQAYAGVGFESPASDQAVEETTGKVLAYQGGLIDVFFHSTCGGRTVPGPEVFGFATRPYLVSVPDVDEGGRAWCALSPRYHWRETWSGEALAAALRATLPGVGGSAALAEDLRDLRILEYTGTGRVGRMEIVGAGGNLVLTGPQARLLLRTRDGASLRSTNFTLEVIREGRRIVELVATGSGAGHGVGMCQWGALGRARAGASADAILSAYYPGTQLIRAY